MTGITSCIAALGAAILMVAAVRAANAVIADG